MLHLLGSEIRGFISSLASIIGDTTARENDWIGDTLEELIVRGRDFPMVACQQQWATRKPKLRSSFLAITCTEWMTSKLDFQKFPVGKM